MDERRTSKAKSRCPALPQERNESAKVAAAVSTENFNRCFRNFLQQYDCSVIVPDAPEDTASDEADSISKVPRTDS